MACEMFLVAVIVCFASFNCILAYEEEKMPDGTTKMSFSTPDLDDDEAHSPFMPDRLKCDACMIIAHQVCLLVFILDIGLTHVLLRTSTSCVRT